MPRTFSITGKADRPTMDKLDAYVAANTPISKSAAIAMAVKDYFNPDHPKPDTEKLLTENQSLKTQVAELQNQVAELNKSNKPSAELAKLQEQNQIHIEEIRQKAAKIEELEAVDNQTLATAKALINELQTEVATLKNTPPTTAKLLDNQVIVTIPPSLKPFLDELCIIETRRVSKKITIANMLLQLMWLQIKVGAGDHLPKSYSSSQIKHVLVNVKKELENE